MAHRASPRSAACGSASDGPAAANSWLSHQRFEAVGMTGGLATLLAVILDRITGEPAWVYRRFPHPAVMMGNCIGFLDDKLNSTASPIRSRLLGLLAVLVALVLFVFPALIIQTLFTPALWTEVLLALVASSLIASKSLFDHVRAVLVPLETGDLPAARRALSMIVGRQTATLDEAAISRAATESLAENYADGVLAPIFWLLLAGLPGIVAYKVINTADSMIGHKTDRHLHFGWAAARLDDVANLVPARLTALLFAVTAFVHPKGSAGNALAAAFKDARHHASPNAGWPEAALAGAINIRLGGPRDYGPYAVDGHWINTAGKQADTFTLIRALRFTKTAWWVMTVLIAFLVAWEVSL